MLTLCNNLHSITFNDNIYSQMCGVKFSFILQSILNAKCILTEPWLKVGSVLKWHFVSEFWPLQHRLCWTSSFTAWAAALHQLPMNTPDRLQWSWRHPYRRLWLAETLWAEIGGYSLAFWFCPSPHLFSAHCVKKADIIRHWSKWGTRFFVMNSETGDWFCRAPLHHHMTFQ